MKNIWTTICATAIFAGAHAQQTGNPAEIKLDGRLRCGFEQVLDKVHVPYSALIDAYRSGDQSTPIAGKGTGVVYDIPVVFHIVYSTATPTFNISDNIVQNQIGVLNKAYRKQHADTGNVRSFFKPLSGDAEIQFHLATIDPQGNPTTGITRTVSSRTYFGATGGDLDSLERMKHTATGGHDPWPTTKYLNIWVGNMTDANGQLSILGYAIPPLNPIPPNWPAGADVQLAGLTDGVMLQTHSVGDNNPLSAALQGTYTKGRAAVHEIGHYLGLQHVFGSNGGGTPSCGAIADDGIGDTPVQSTQSMDQSTPGCPSATKNSCGAGTTGDLPDMWENYMDYARDACQTMFTNGQIAIIRSVMANQRNTLLHSLSVPGVAGSAFGIYPNPAQSKISVILTGVVTKASIRNMLGQEVAHFSGSAAGSKSYDISSLPAGNYVLLLEAGDRTVANKFSIIR